MRERRVGVRAISFFRTDVRHKSKTYHGYIVNISSTGCAFAHENLTAVAEGDIVNVKFRVDEKSLNLQARVSWRDNTIMGLRYAGLTDSSKKVLKEYIKTVTLRQIPI